MGPGFNLNFVMGNRQKSSQNSPKPVAIFWSSNSVLYIYALLKVVGCYDLIVLSMSVMGFQVWMDGCEHYPIFFFFLELF